MSNDNFTEVTSESWFSRLGGAIKGILVGIVLIIVALVLLFWNEGRSVKEYKTLKEGAGSVISVASDAVDPANAGKLIHTTGKADTKAVLSDPIFGVSANALQLRRVAEMYQWKETSHSETQKKLGGGEETKTTYSYEKTWSASAINSSDFRIPEEHQNPATMPYESSTQLADTVSLGKFNLPASLVERIDETKPLVIQSADIKNKELPTGIKLQAGGFYSGANPATPKIGDQRITFEVVNPMEVSVIAKQVRDTFEPYATSAGGEIELLETGIHSADAIIQHAQESNTLMTWIIRLIGFILLVIGINMEFKVLSVIADVLPIAGDIIGAGTGIIAFLLAVILALVTIAIAWIFYRPLLAIILLAAVVGVITVIKLKLNKQSKVAA
jgi:hypothetical protein